MKTEKTNDLNENIERIMITPEQISERVKALAAQLDKLYEGRTPVVVCILKGSVMFFADLIREMKSSLQIDFMAVSSYGKDTISSGKLQVKKDLTVNISGKDVLIVEDIIDSGNTLYQLKKMLNGRSPNSVNIVTLLDKPEPSRSTYGARIQGVCYRGRIRGGVRAGLCRRIPQSSLRGRIETFRLREISFCAAERETKK